MKKVFISQPMRGLTDEQILKAREEIKERVSQKVNEEIEIIDSFISDYPGEVNKQVPVWYLGKSIQLLSQADIAYFGGDWADARGCKLEHSIAEAYGLEVIEELKEEPNKTPNIYALTTSLLCNKRVDQVVSNLCTYELAQLIENAEEENEFVLFETVSGVEIAVRANDIVCFVRVVE